MSATWQDVEDWMRDVLASGLCVLDVEELEHSLEESAAPISEMAAHTRGSRMALCNLVDLVKRRELHPAAIDWLVREVHEAKHAAGKVR